VLAAGLYFGPGTTIGPLQVDADRRGYVIATAAAPTRALELADEAAQRLVVRTTRADRAFDRALRRLRARQLVPIAAVLALVLGGAFALIVSDHAKLQRALVGGIRVDKTFSPVCHCATDVAHVTFRLIHAGRITVQMVNSVGHPVATVLRGGTARAGWKHFVWNGLTHTGRVLPNGAYFPEVSFPLLHRSLRLPSPVNLDTQPPRLLHLTASTARGRLVLHYEFDSAAHAVLRVDGKRISTSRFAAISGRLVWAERFPGRRRAQPGELRIVVLGIDAAGNRSLPRRVQLIPGKPQQ
jgi:hypothetical protein